MRLVAKTISFLLIISLSFPLFVYADSDTASRETADSHISQLSSSNIDAAVFEKLELNPTDRVIKIYSLFLTEAFSKYTAIRDLLTSESVLCIYVVVSKENRAKDAYISSNGSELVSADEDILGTIPVTAYYDESIIKNISPSITVYNTYYLYAHGVHQGYALYYETDMGNYVYYYAGWMGGANLMPSAAFVDCMVIRHKELIETAKLGGSIYSIPNYYEIYNMNSENFDPHYLPAHLDPNAAPEKADVPWLTAAAIAAGALIVIAVGSLIWWKRKRDAEYDFW